MGLALGTNFKFYNSVAKGLKLKVKKVWRLIPTFVEVTWEKLVGGGGLFGPPPILNRAKEDFFQLMNNSVFVKTMENVRKHRNIRLATTERRRNYLVPKPSYLNTKFFTERLLAIKRKNQR